MTDARNLNGWFDRTVIGREGEPLGRVEEIYLDDVSGAPKWALLSSAERSDDPPFVPLAGAEDAGATLRLPVDRRATIESPRLRARDGELSPEQEEALSRHYFRESAHREPVPTETTDGDPVMVRSEEELVVHKTTRPTERVRLIKRIVTETVTREVELRREELHVERVPVEAGEVAEGVAVEGAFADGDEEIVLLEEEVVVTTRVVPRERVRLVRSTVVEQRPVSAELRSEQVELERRTH